MERYSYLPPGMPFDIEAQRQAALANIPPAPPQGEPCTLGALLETMHFDSDEKQIEWLIAAMNRLVLLLNTKDATEAACVARYEAKYAVLFEDMQKNLRHIREAYQIDSGRYALLRRRFVKVPQLKIAATGQDLDRRLDRLIERDAQLRPAPAPPPIPEIRA